MEKESKHNLYLPDVHYLVSLTSIPQAPIPV